jgi:hypothetical protein
MPPRDMNQCCGVRDRRAMANAGAGPRFVLGEVHCCPGQSWDHGVAVLSVPGVFRLREQEGPIERFPVGMRRRRNP